MFFGLVFAVEDSQIDSEPPTPRLRTDLEFDYLDERKSIMRYRSTEGAMAIVIKTKTFQFLCNN